MSRRSNEPTCPQHYPDHLLRHLSQVAWRTTRRYKRFRAAIDEAAPISSDRETAETHRSQKFTMPIDRRSPNSSRPSRNLSLEGVYPPGGINDETQ